MPLEKCLSSSTMGVLCLSVSVEMLSVHPQHALFDRWVRFSLVTSLGVLNLPARAFQSPVSSCVDGVPWDSDD